MVSVWGRAAWGSSAWDGGGVAVAAASDALVLSDAARVRLPYLHKPPHDDDGYSLGVVSAGHSLGTMQDRYTLGPVKGQQP
jgi:hypothetical protein